MKSPWSSTCVLAATLTLLASGRAAVASLDRPAAPDQMSVLPAGSVKLDGFLERYIDRSIQHWSKGVLPYAALADFFRHGRPSMEYDGKQQELFATGEMWGKAVRSTALFYRYTGDPELKKILQKTVADLLSTRRSNGSISCTPVDKQPDGPMGDIWERKYVLLGLEEYYDNVEKDRAVLQAMIDEVDATIAQVGPPPKARIVDLGWSAYYLGDNNVESSTILEPVMRLYNITGYPRFLEFAKYIVGEGGARNHNLIEEVLSGKDPKDIGGTYPKAYEMMSFFEGLMEYYRVTGNEKIREACLALYHKIIEKEITLIGNGGGDQPYHPKVEGEAWDNTALEQTNPDIKRMMETCAGVTWLKFCHQILRLTADPMAADYIELYAYNGLIGAMKPTGDGFSYVNLLNGKKTEPEGWGTDIAGVYVTCCNLNGPEGLAYLPLVAVMHDAEGPVVNLYNAGSAIIPLAEGNARLRIAANYPLDGDVRIEASPDTARRFAVKLRIPAWSKATVLKVNGEAIPVSSGSYARIERLWSPGDVISLTLDMRCRLIAAPHGSHPASGNFQALVRGPIVLARDENIDPHFNDPVEVIATGGIVKVQAMKPSLPETGMQFAVPTRNGPITMVYYASVNSWQGKRVCTWLPKLPPQSASQ